MPVLDEILVLIFILAHVDRILTTASFEVVDHLYWCLNGVLKASIVYSTMMCCSTPLLLHGVERERGGDGNKLKRWIMADG